MAIRALDDGEIDTVDLVIAVETAFDIRILDREAERTLTVGDLHRLVMRKLGHRLSEACLSAAAFRRVRAALAEEARLARSAIRPSTPMKQLLWRPSAELWRRITKRLGIGKCALARTATTRRWMFGLCLYVGFGAAIEGMVLSFGGMGVVACGLAGMAAAWALALILTLPLQSHPPFATVADMSYAVTAADFRSQTQRRWSPIEREVWDKLVAIVAEQYGVRSSEVLPDTRFVGDLDVGDRILRALGAT